MIILFEGTVSFEEWAKADKQGLPDSIGADGLEAIYVHYGLEKLCLEKKGQLRW